MYCKNCGKLLEEGDKFCSGCGTRVEEALFVNSAPVSERPKEAAEERPKKKFHMEEFNWDLDGYPASQKKKTEDIDFNWESVLEEKQRRAFGQSPLEEEKETAETLEPETKTLEEEIFGNLEQQAAAEPTKVFGQAGTTEGVDKFYTFNKKNEEFQALLDQEYERIKNGEEPPNDEKLSFARRDSVSNEAVLEQILEASESEAAADVPAEKEASPGGYVGVVWAQTPECVLAADEALMAEAAEPAKVQTQQHTADEFPCPPSCEEPEKEEAAEHKLTFDDVFGIDDGDADEKPKKKGKALKVIAIILCILVALELIIIGIQYFAPDSAPGKVINSGYQYIISLFGGDDSKEKDSGKASEDRDLLDMEALIKANESKNKNLAKIEADQSMLFSDDKDYGFEDFGNSITFIDEPWYTAKDGGTITYGNAIVETLIQYYSSWVDMAKGENDKALYYVDETSDFYTEVESIEPEKQVQYGINKLSIGEIRAGGSGFYVLTAIAKVSSDTEKETVEHHIVYLEPNQEAMKIIEIKKI